MKYLILYYSYTGHTKACAEFCASREGADDIAEIRDVKRPNKLKAFTAGVAAALRGKAWPIEELAADLAAYEHIHIFSPVWAGHMPPAVHAAIALLPAGARVSLCLVSATGGSRCREQAEAAIRARGCEVVGFADLKA
ncbi:MAG: hypothetical protein FWF10_01970 [Clostridiales bacterium]|nr:hypothetical protein [Clostridiales bacterium]